MFKGWDRTDKFTSGFLAIVMGGLLFGGFMILQNPPWWGLPALILGYLIFLTQIWYAVWSRVRTETRQRNSAEAAMACPAGGRHEWDPAKSRVVGHSAGIVSIELVCAKCLHAAVRHLSDPDQKYLVIRV